MITGDHAVTAGAIAREHGIPGRAISGAEFAEMTDEAADAQIDDIGVIAPVTPEQKVRLLANSPVSERHVATGMTRSDVGAHDGRRSEALISSRLCTPDRG